MDIEYHKNLKKNSFDAQILNDIILGQTRVYN